MSSKCAPPKFIECASEYEAYKRKLKQWTRITKVDKKQMADTVLYNLSEHPSGIAEQAAKALGDEIVEKDDGMDKLITYFDSVYGEDEMTSMWSKYKICEVKEVG